MQTLNLINSERGNIKYSISRFPDGEVQITVGEFSRKDIVEVNCRITNAEELFILMQVADILSRHEVEWHLNIYYLMGMRMDRVMDFNRPFSLKIIGGVIRNLGAKRIALLEPHSDVSYEVVGGQYDSIDPANDLYMDLHPDSLRVFNNYLVVYPDAGAYDRYGWSNRQVVRAEKVRDISTGKIESIRIVNPETLSESNLPIIVVDDLCDGGGTFVGLAKEIRKYTDKELNIFVTHMVNPKGIENLAKMYDHVYFTNSYKDWNIFKAEYGKVVPFLPENVTQIDVV